MPQSKQYRFSFTAGPTLAARQRPWQEKNLSLSRILRRSASVASAAGCCRILKIAASHCSQASSEKGVRVARSHDDQQTSRWLNAASRPLYYAANSETDRPHHPTFAGGEARKFFSFFASGSLLPEGRRAGDEGLRRREGHPPRSRLPHEGDFFRGSIVRARNFGLDD
jgi:hypothetical protein